MGNAHDFTSTRRAFVYIDGVLYVQDEGDSRPSKQWVAEAFGLSEERWAVLQRGYIAHDRIQFFSGEHYEFDGQVEDSMVEELRDVHRDIYGTSFAPSVYNGVVEGEEGATWEPRWEYDPIGGGWNIC